MSVVLAPDRMLLFFSFKTILERALATSGNPAVGCGRIVLFCWPLFSGGKGGKDELFGLCAGYPSSEALGYMGWTASSGLLGTVTYPGN